MKTGKSRHYLYGTWRAMRYRCSNEKCKIYPRYGGRGISVCARWSSFENFIQDMGDRPDGLSIDRINNNGNYEPSNCRWATPTQQIKNTWRSLQPNRLKLRATVATAVTPSEYAIVENAARRANMRKSAWVRAVVLAAAEKVCGK